MSRKDRTDLCKDNDDSFIVIKSEKDILKERINILVNSNEKLEISVRNFIKELNDLQNINLDLEKQIQEKEDEKTDANLELKKAQEEIAILKQQLISSNEELKQIESNLKWQNQQSNKLKSKLMVFNTSMENLKAQKFKEKKQDSDVSELKLQIEWMKVKIQIFEDDKIKNDEQLKILQEEKELLLGELFIEELNKLQEKLENSFLKN